MRSSHTGEIQTLLLAPVPLRSFPGLFRRSWEPRKKKTSCVGIRNGVVIQGNLRSPPGILCNRIKHHTVTLSLLSLSLSIPPSLPHALPSFPLPSPPPFSHINTLKYIRSKKTLWSHFAVKLTQLGTFISSVYYSIKRNQIATPQYGIGYS